MLGVQGGMPARDRLDWGSGEKVSRMGHHAKPTGETMQVEDVAGIRRIMKE